MKAFFVFVLALVFSSYFTYSQDIDSLYSVFNASRGATRISFANEIVKYAFENSYIDNLTTLKTSDDEAFVNATVHDAMGCYLMLAKGDYTKSNDFFKLTFEYHEKRENAAIINLINNNIGSNYVRMGDYENAVTYKMKCYEWEKSVGDVESLSGTLNDLGVIYSHWKRHETAIRYFEEAERVERPLNRPMQYANRLSSLAKE